MQAWHEAWAREAFRIAKPGAHLLAFGGTRTVHRLAAAIEDAGWEIRDMLVWGYASGFPKSLDVSKAIDRAAGAEREVVGTRTQLAWRRTASGVATTSGDDRRGTVDDVTAPATPDAEKWNGWGTALKPAWEPIVMARKPLRGTVAANVLRHGTGALNIDGTRIGTTDDRGDGARQRLRRRAVSACGRRSASSCADRSTAGRWPANVILTDPIFDGGVEGVVGGGETTSRQTARTDSRAASTATRMDRRTGQRDVGLPTATPAPTPASSSSPRVRGPSGSRCWAGCRAVRVPTQATTAYAGRATTA